MNKQSLQKRKFRMFSRLLGIAIFTLFLLTNEAFAQVQVNDNGGFEASAVTAGADTSSLQNWWFQFGDYASASVIGDTVFTGSKALRVRIDSLAANSYDIQIVNENIPLEPGATYTFSMWARTGEGTGSTNFTMGNLSYQEFGRLGEAAITETWQEFSFEFVADGSSGEILTSDSTGRAAMHLSIDGNAGQTLFFDQLRITKPHGNDNGSFEASEVTVSGDTSAVRGWMFNLGGGGEANFAITDEEAKDGNNSLAVTVNTQGDNAYSIEALGIPVQAVPGETYQYSVYAKASEAGSSVHLTVGNFDYQESLRFEQNSAVGTEWQLFTNEFTVPATDSTVIRAPIHFSFAENVGATIYIDSLRITQISGTEEELSKVPVVVEAESGTLGSEWEVTDDTDISYVSITTDFDETTGAAGYPGENRTISYSVEFPGTGDYDLFAKVRVGSEGANDDSFFQANSFGEKDPANADDWYLINSIDIAGFAEPTDIVRGAGGVGSEEWKWINFSRNAFTGDTALTRTVSGGLTKTFEIGARENGLEIDKFVFGRSDLYFTVENLENGEAGSETDPTIEPPVELDPIAEGKDKFLGNVWSNSQIQDFTSYWNQVTPENAGKWGSVESTRDQMNWNGLDAAYALAKDNGFPFRFHILIWGAQQPNWINDLSSEEQLEEIEEWMDAVAERYPDLDYVEVVNEGSNNHQLPDGITGDADYIDALGGTGETGHDWIITSFEMARERFPNAKLMINDYGIVGNAGATANYLEIIEDLQERDLIDVIGVQSHAFSTGSPSSALKSSLDRLGNTGLPIQATEMDIDGNPGGSDAESDQEQLEEYQRVFPIYWEHPSVEGVTLWGWRTGLWRNDQEAYIIRNNGEERPALEWLRAYVDSAQVSVSNEELGADVPAQFELYNNYPNPFNPTTQIKYSIPQSSEVRISVFDITGRLIQTLVDGRKASGSHTVTFNASGISSGVYFYRIEAGSFVNVKRMMLIK